VALSILLILYGVWITPGARSLTMENIIRMVPAFVILGVYVLVAILAPAGMSHRSTLIPDEWIILWFFGWRSFCR
jgi:hypothetical protein